MAQGNYKNGEVIEVIYQATGAQTGLDDVKMDVYDEGHAIDAGKGVAAMTEIGTTGRHYAAFTPDTEGEWSVLIDSIAKPGKIIKQYSVTAHNIDSVGDAVATADGKIDTVDSKVDALQDVSKAEVNTEVDTALADYDAPTKAELDSGLAALNDIDAAAIAGELATYDVPTKAEMDAKIDAQNNLSTDDVDARLTAYDVAKASDVTAPPMVG